MKFFEKVFKKRTPAAPSQASTPKALTSLVQGLGKTASSLKEGVKKALTHKKLDQTMCDALEEALLKTDMGLPLAEHFTKSLRQQKFAETITQEAVEHHLATLIEETLTPVEKPLAITKATPFVLFVVGVNGAGKTTTIGKLAHRFKAQGLSVHLAAADTYRAAAVAQLNVWAERTQTPITTPEKEGADPASLLFKAYEAAAASKADVLICDTAGRLQNRQDLMAQLEKMVRILRKKDEAAPHASVLVLDATVGQNAHSQVEAFKEIAALTGLIITKLDSTAKGGVVVSLAKTFGLPIHFIGIGEGVDDLKPFNAHDFAKALVN